jgi:hypothetical protein
LLRNGAIRLQPIFPDWALGTNLSSTLQRDSFFAIATIERITDRSESLSDGPQGSIFPPMRHVISENCVLDFKKIVHSILIKLEIKF